MESSGAEVDEVMLPWVSRAAYDLVLADRAALQAKYDALLVDHLAYLRPTATMSTAKVPIPAKERDNLMALAAERGGRDAGLRRHLIAYVEKERASGATDETIADRLTHWNDPEDDGE